MQVELVRLTTDKKLPQLGVLRFDGVPRLLTLELPDLDNQPKISCIPKGTYKCGVVYQRRTSGGLIIPKTYEVIGVPNRSGILFHVGNTAHDSQGCILLGQRFDYLKSDLAVLQSKLAFSQFISLLASQPSFELSVI